MPISPTSAQSQASRLNGARSSGPNTDEGKARSAQNATQHGLRAERFELRDDERRFAAELRHGLAARLLPADAAERAAVEALVVCEIKLARLDLLEMRVLDRALDDQAEETSRRLPSLSTLDRYRGRIMRERRELEARFEILKAGRSQLTGKGAMTPEALRFLADLAERKAAETASQPPVQPANDDCCTNGPEITEGPAASGVVPGDRPCRTNQPESASPASH